MITYAHSTVQVRYSRRRRDAIALPNADREWRPVFAIADGTGLVGTMSGAAVTAAVQAVEQNLSPIAAVLAGANAAAAETTYRSPEDNVSLCVLLGPGAGNMSVDIATAGDGARVYAATDRGQLDRLTEPQPPSRILLPTYQRCLPHAQECGWGAQCADHGPVFVRQPLNTRSGARIIRLLMTTSGVTDHLRAEEIRSVLVNQGTPATAARELTARAQHAAARRAKSCDASALVIDL